MEKKLEGPDPARWGVLAAVCGGLFMIMLQSNVINIAVTRIQKDFGVSLETVEWVTNGYLLVFTSLLVLLGRLGDRFGRKLMFLGGVVVYTAGAFAAGFAHSIGLLIGGALIQGVGGAAMMPATLSLITVNFDKKERGAALGVWGAVSGLAVAVGPTLGGYLTDVGLGDAINSVLHLEQGWRAIYFLNCLVGVAVFLAALFLIKESRDGSVHHGFDVVGTVLSAVAQFALVYGLINASRYGWIRRKEAFTVAGWTAPLGDLSVTPVLVAFALVVGVFFILWEKSRKSDPLMELSLFRNVNYSAGSLVAAILNFAMMGSFFLIPVFLQGVLGFSATRAGLAMLPLALAVIVASPVAGRLTDRFGARWVIVIGMAVLAAGGFLTARFALTTSVASLIVPFAIQGLGIGLAMAPITNAALFGVPIGIAGAASGTLSMIRQFGSILGIAIMAAVFSSGIAPHMQRSVEALDPAKVPAVVKEKILSGLSSGTSSQPSGEEMKKMLSFYSKKRGEEISGAVSGAMKQGMVDSINETFRYAAGVAVLGACAALLLRGKKKEDGE